jgi:hypothetical protein
MVDQMTNAGVGFKVVVLCFHPMKSTSVPQKLTESILRKRPELQDVQVGPTYSKRQQSGKESRL